MKASQMQKILNKRKNSPNFKATKNRQESTVET